VFEPGKAETITRKARGLGVGDEKKKAFREAFEPRFPAKRRKGFSTVHRKVTRSSTGKKKKTPKKKRTT